MSVFSKNYKYCSRTETSNAWPQRQNRLIPLKTRHYVSHSSPHRDRIKKGGRVSSHSWYQPVLTFRSLVWHFRARTVVLRHYKYLRNHLWHQEEVLVLESGDSVVQDGSAGRVVIRGSSGLVIDPGVDPLLDNHESEPWVVIIRQHLVKFASSSRAATAHVSETSIQKRLQKYSITL